MSVIEENFGSNLDTLYPHFLSDFIQDAPVSKLTCLSLEVPPNTTRIFFLDKFIFSLLF